MGIGLHLRHDSVGATYRWVLNLRSRPACHGCGTEHRGEVELQRVSVCALGAVGAVEMPSPPLALLVQRRQHSEWVVSPRIGPRPACEHASAHALSHLPIRPLIGQRDHYSGHIRQLVIICCLRLPKHGHLLPQHSQ